MTRTRTVVNETVDQCWFCKRWFLIEALKEIRVNEYSFGSDTIPKPICDHCLKEVHKNSERKE
jgi:hypothetical protein